MSYDPSITCLLCMICLVYPAEAMRLGGAIGNRATCAMWECERRGVSEGKNFYNLQPLDLSIISQFL